jgi:acyl-ACP thioesterase
MQPVAKYFVETKLESSHVDFKRELRMIQAFMWFQDIAAAHAENLGAGVTKLVTERNVAWVIMRMRVEVDRLPLLDEDIVIGTWPQATGPLYERDYDVKTKDGESLLRAASVWIIMDLGTRDIVKDFLVDYHEIDPLKDRALGIKLRQLKAPKELTETGEKHIAYSDLDYNGHVNNTKYFDYIYDCFELAYHEKYRVSAAEINYINEAHIDEDLVMYTADLPDAPDAPVKYIEGRSRTDDRVVFKAKIEFSPRG